MTVKIFCEDKKGKPFFERLIKRMKKEGRFGNISVKVGFIGGSVGTVLERRIKASLREGCSKFIVIYDAHGDDINKVRNKVLRFIPDNVRPKTCIVILDFEIEEWICISEEINCGSKPYETLKNRIGYEKYRLPDYAERLDFNKLINCRSFLEFLDCLK